MTKANTQTLVAEFVNNPDKYHVAGKFVKLLGNDMTYDLATTLLEYLKDRDYCIWQTYTKSNLQQNTGKKRITHDDMQEYSERLQDFCSIE